MLTALSTLQFYLKAYLGQDKGQDLIEYALIAALISVALVGGLTALSGGIGGVFTSVTSSF